MSQVGPVYDSENTAGQTQDSNSINLSQSCEEYDGVIDMDISSLKSGENIPDGDNNDGNYSCSDDTVLTSDTNNHADISVESKDHT